MELQPNSGVFLQADFKSSITLFTINLYQIHHQRLIKNPLNVVYELLYLSHKPECYPHVYLCLNKRKFLLRCGLTVHLKVKEPCTAIPTGAPLPHTYNIVWSVATFIHVPCNFKCILK